MNTTNLTQWFNFCFAIRSVVLIQNLVNDEVMIVFPTLLIDYPTKIFNTPRIAYLILFTFNFNATVCK
jgi:hypothetical protein